MVTNCGCFSPSVYEETRDITLNYISNQEIRLFFPTTDINDLKRKAIVDLEEILQQLECGIQPDLELLLEKIALIEIEND